MKGYSRNTETLTAILLVILALTSFSSIISTLRYGLIGGSLSMVVTVAGYVLLAVSMFRSKRDYLALAGVGLCTLLALISFFTGFGGGILPILCRLMNLASWVIIALIACNVILKQPQMSVGQFVMLPMILTAVYSVLNVISSIINFTAFGYSMIAFVPTLIGTLFGAVLAVLVAMLIPKWFLGEAAQKQANAAGIAAQKQAQIGYYYNLMTQGAITPEEFERKRWEIENN